MKKSKLYLAAILGISVVFSACSDPKKPSEANFKAAIQQSIDTLMQGKACFTDANFPRDEDRWNKETSKTNEKLQALERLGLLSSEVKSEKILHSTEEWKVYDLTEKGKQQVFEVQNRPTKTSKMLCAGDVKVTSVTNFTEPSDAMGRTVSQVNFDLTVTNLPDWAKDEEFQQIFPNYAKFAKGESIETKTTLILTNNGWVEASLFGK